MFRTVTGQTGKDAYIYEAAAIANAQRELNTRMKKLVDTIKEEAPDLAFYTRPAGPNPRASDAREVCELLMKEPTVEVPKKYQKSTWDALYYAHPDLAHAIAEGVQADLRPRRGLDVYVNAHTLERICAYIAKDTDAPMETVNLHFKDVEEPGTNTILIAARWRGIAVDMGYDAFYQWRQSAQGTEIAKIKKKAFMKGEITKPSTFWTT
jgi:hypothetical protein